MIMCQLFVDGFCKAERNWPTVPRIGESLTISELTGAHRIADVVWFDSHGTLIARIHMHPLADNK
jgi:hypothetical protein